MPRPECGNGNATPDCGSDAAATAAICEHTDTIVITVISSLTSVCWLPLHPFSPTFFLIVTK